MGMGNLPVIKCSHRQKNSDEDYSSAMLQVFYGVEITIVAQEWDKITGKE
jgi:hypothetical protein